MGSAADLDTAEARLSDLAADVERLHERPREMALELMELARDVMRAAECAR